MEPLNEHAAHPIPSALAAALSGSDDQARLGTLRVRLAEDAHAAGLVDVAYRTVDSPIGSLLVAATDAGLLRIAFASEDHAKVLDDLARSVGARVLRDERRLDAASRELDDYFGGRRREFTVAVDLRVSGDFRRAVLDVLRTIPYGTTFSYADVATRAGNARAVRAAGSACAANPIPIVVPCHRVVRSDGVIGNYLGGTATKRWLLDAEGALTTLAP
jgi:methylated-DNA-[protein]-cysteine S-methyltransferase